MTTAFGNRKLTNFLIMAALAALMGCSKEKDTLPARLYHNTTSYFNGYYNANYLYNETLQQLEKQYDFPAEGFIEVVYYGTEDEIKSYISDFETIIEKNDVVMFKHPKGDWIDDCRLLNGKCWMYRKNYTLAHQNFDYILDKFPESDQIAEVWFRKAEAFYLAENGQMARSLIQEQILENDSLIIPPDVLAEISLFRTRLAIEDEDYQEAIKLLEPDIEFLKDRQRRARSHFLLGQLYAKNGNFARSMEQFNLVGKYSDDYDLTFKAKISIARLYVDFQEGKDEEDVVYKYLTGLLKDEKNEEYQDQVYYEFALLALKKEQREEGLEYLRESLRVNVNNKRQKALSYYKIGQIYFYDVQDYTNAQAYYDSAASVITKTAPEYREITNLAATLKDYITYKEIIHYTDSMLILAEMPKEELDAMIDKMIADEKARKEAEAQALLEQMQNKDDPFYNPALQMNNQGGRRNGNQGGKWYFDNQAAMSNGKIQFQQTWGRRSNEDHWRRSKKTLMVRAPDATGIAGAAGPAVAGAATAEPVDSALLETYGDKYKYYKDIPREDADFEKAYTDIETAMYKLGQVYAQKLDELDSAVQTFERILDRFENSDYTLRARYALYNLYLEKGNTPLAEVHKSYILNEHPKSVYAYLILGKDPNELKEEVADFRFAYSGLFSSYKEEQYETSLGFSEFLLAQAEFAETPEELDMARLYYIKGMSYGFLGQKDSLRDILTYVVSNYPSHEVTPIAQKTLNYMNKGLPKKKLPTGSSDGTVDKFDPRFKGFKEEPASNDKVFVLLYIDKTLVSRNEATTQIADFNKRLFKEKKLKAFVFMYKQTHLLPYISHFKTVGEAEKYIEAFQKDEVSKNLMKTGEEKIYYITNTNFKVAYGQKRMTDYHVYYDKILTATK